MEVIHAIPQSKMDREQLSDFLKKNSFSTATVKMDVHSDQIEFIINENTRVWVWNLAK